MRRTILFPLLAFLCWAAVAPAQQGEAYDAELSVPFGTSVGKLMLLGPYLVFYDTDDPANSLVVQRSQVAKMTADGPAIVVQLTEPIQHRSGPRAQLNLRLAGMQDASSLVRWQSGGGAGAPSTAATPGTGSGAQAGSPEIKQTYEARHEHTFGACNGRLLLTGNRLIYESLDNASHSRQWALAEIRQIRQRNPLRLTVESQGDERYEFTLQGTGMESQTFRGLVDAITKARVSQGR
jgi:hypothetical protein